MITSNILAAVSKKNDFELIQEFQFTHSDENELLLFFKPESFFADDVHAAKLIDMVFAKLASFDVKISGIAKLSGEFIRKFEIMDRHYGFINRMSKTASTGLNQEELEKLMAVTGISDLAGWEILGGHEFLQAFPSQTIDSLGQYWFSKPSLKVRSGLYAQTFEVEGKNVILVNGFHPAQLAHLQNSNHKVVIVLVHTNTNWSVLKNDLAGNTFPEKASAQSIRGEILSNKELYKAEKVTANFNFVHLSAGAFEALFEINNFLSCIPEAHYSIEKTNVARKVKDLDVVNKAIANPVKEFDGKPIDLFSKTEEINTTEAIQVLSGF